MDSRILLGKILQRFSDNRVVKIEDYNSFGYLKETGNAVFVLRETGQDTRVPFDKILTGIEAYQANPALYNLGQKELRTFGITHVTSPVWSLLHLLKLEDYAQ